MATPASPERFMLITAKPSDDENDFPREVAAGLTGSPKSIPCRFFYDREGSRLFEEICELPEYYLTRAEREILRDRAAEIAAGFPQGTKLVELGSGNAAKTRLLIEAFLQRQGELLYVPVDIAHTTLVASSIALQKEYPALKVTAIAAEYHDGLRKVHRIVDSPKLILWLGSNVGNFGRAEAADFLRRVRDGMTEEDRLLVGIDLRKDRAALERAYDDAQGVTAQFNLNLLARINRELGGNFDPEAFRHQAVYNEEIGRVEMYLVSQRDQRVPIKDLDMDIAFAAGETIHTENAYKYSPTEIDALAVTAGFRIEHQWFDADRRFSLDLLAPVSD